MRTFLGLAFPQDVESGPFSVRDVWVGNTYARNGKKNIRTVVSLGRGILTHCYLTDVHGRDKALSLLLVEDCLNQENQGHHIV